MSKWSGQQLNNDDNHVFTAGQTFKWIECYYAITSNVQLIYNNNCIQGICMRQWNQLTDQQSIYIENFIQICIERESKWDETNETVDFEFQN